MKNKLTLILGAFLMTSFLSCQDTGDLEGRLDNLENRIAALEEAVGDLNNNVVALNRLYDKELLIVGVKEMKTEDGKTDKGYILEFSDGSAMTVTFGASYQVAMPLVRVVDGHWEVSYDGGKTYEKYGAVSYDGNTPQFRIDEEGYWTARFGDGEYTRITDEYGRFISAVDKTAAVTKPLFTNVTYDKASAELVLSMYDGSTFRATCVNNFIVNVELKQFNPIFLGETKTYKTELSEVAELVITAPEGWEANIKDGFFNVTSPETGTAGNYTISVYAVSTKGYIKKVDLEFTLNPITPDEAVTPAYRNFLAGDEDNLLLDFSYAGYNHGETAPAENSGYRVYNIMDYGAVPNDGKSDRDAFLTMVKAATGKDYVEQKDNIAFNPQERANAVLYFPEGEFILHNADDDVNGVSKTIVIRAGSIIMKGAGREKTRIVMDAPNQPTDPNVMYSSPSMLAFKHFSALSSFKVPAAVTSNAAKSSFTVTVANASEIHTGDYVALYVKNKSEEFVNKELAPYASQKNSSWDIVSKGVEVIDYHQVKSVNGNEVTFAEPIMHEVDAAMGWEIMKFPHYEEVGIEDLTFVGHAKEKFGHHASWEDDGAYKPLDMMRLANSWIRRVGFESTSEACSIINSANVSAYDIVFTGNRGHASVRSQGSSRVFIGATVDNTSGYLARNSSGILSTFIERAGNYHAVGVSKHSMGAVLWRNSWGYDACFESHATQPRATLIDCCDGGWMRSRQGGDATQMPNHLNDLTIWNFHATNANLGGVDAIGDINSNFIFWDKTSQWWKMLPPVIVGFAGPANTHFDASQCKLVESEGTPVYPESLYEAQLKNRLGYVPTWLETLK